MKNEALTKLALTDVLRHKTLTSTIRRNPAKEFARSQFNKVYGPATSDELNSIDWEFVVGYVTNTLKKKEEN